jgi:hypothetical protein
MAEKSLEGQYRHIFPGKVNAAYFGTLKECDFFGAKSSQQQVL